MLCTSLLLSLDAPYLYFEADKQFWICRLGLEQLLRKLLTLENHPAIIDLQYHPFRAVPHYSFAAEVCCFPPIDCLMISLS